MHHHGLTTVEWATVLGTGFTALAALAACATVLIDLIRQRGAFMPNVSGGFLARRASRLDSLHFANAGPGLAIALSYMGVDEGRKYGGYVGTGHLLPGQEIDVPIGKFARTGEAHFVWTCRDARGFTHLWSYDERYKRFSPRQTRRMGLTKLGDYFARMYPEIEMPPSQAQLDSPDDTE